MRAFDQASPDPNCVARGNSTVVAQSLALLNSSFMQEQARQFDERVIQSGGGEPEAPTDRHVQTAFLLALGRAPTSAELRFCEDYLRSQTELYRRLKSPAAKAARQTLAGLCSILLACNEFLYIG